MRSYSILRQSKWYFTSQIKCTTNIHFSLISLYHLHLSTAPSTVEKFEIRWKTNTAKLKIWIEKNSTFLSPIFLLIQVFSWMSISSEIVLIPCEFRYMYYNILFFHEITVFLCIRKVYVLSRNENYESHWMTFDIDTQHWKVFNNDLSSRCYGSILNIRNVHYFFSDICEKVHKILFFVHMILLLGHRWQFLEWQ